MLEHETFEKMIIFLFGVYFIFLVSLTRAAKIVTLSKSMYNRCSCLVLTLITT